MKDKKLFILVSILLICCCFVVLYQDSYAKYKKKVDQNVGITLASWNIKLNNESVAGKETVEGNIIPTFENNEYTAENVIAPGSIGYFDITIDATEVDVSFSYELSVVVNDNELYPDIIAYGYAINPTEDSVASEFPQEGITGTISHNSNDTSIRIFIKWDDSENASMDNIQDTALAIANEEVSMKASFHFTQIKGN